MDIKVRPVCPFNGGQECIACGITNHSMRNGILNPCAFFEECCPSDTEPCIIKRAMNKILGRPDFPDENVEIEVPWNTDNKNKE